MESNIKSKNKEVINQEQAREQALNGWIVIDTAATATASGNFSGIHVLAGESATITLTFKDGTKTCNVNGSTIDLVEGAYLPTPGLITAEVTVGKVVLIKDQIF